MNMLYDLAAATGADYSVVAAAMAADPRIGSSHLQVLDSSGHPGAVVGRGAGGHCFPKDWAALRAVYESQCASDAAGAALLRAVEAKNNALLRDSHKDLDLLYGIYGV
jgi:UDP-glucose 6-dehydrogenase